MTQVELLPCPFCNGDAMRNAPATRYVHGVHCTKCVCELTAFDTQAAADAAWNTRTPLEQAAASQAAVSEGPPFEPTNAMSTAGKHYMKGQEELFERRQAIGCWRVMYRAWQESLSSQAPKPASAGGDPRDTALGLMKECAQKLHKMVYDLGWKYPEVPEFDDDGALHDAIHDVLRVDTPTAIAAEADTANPSSATRVTSTGSLLRPTVHIDVSAPRPLPDLVVTRDGVPVADQAQGIRDFLEACTPKEGKS